MFSVVGCSVAITDIQQTSEELKIERTSLFSHYSSEERQRSVPLLNGVRIITVVPPANQHKGLQCYCDNIWRPQVKSKPHFVHCCTASTLKNF